MLHPSQGPVLFLHIHDYIVGHMHTWGDSDIMKLSQGASKDVQYVKVLTGDCFW